MEEIFNIRSSLRKFNQAFLIGKAYLASFIEDYPELNLKGVCNGLCIDYTRHVISHKNTNKESDYISKLNSKLGIFGKSSKNFAKRIQSYQNSLQANLFDNDISLYEDGANQINANNFINSLPEKIKSSSVVGLNFVGSEYAHIIAIQVIRSENLEATGYKIFDPNFGEFDCSKNEDVAENLKNCNYVVKKIYQKYSSKGMEKCSIRDLEELVTKYELIKPKDRFIQYNSEYKYLEQNPNKQEIENNNLHSAICGQRLNSAQRSINNGADVNRIHVDEFPPFFYAAENKDKKMMELLLKNGADVNQTDAHGYTALLRFVLLGNSEFAEFLLTKGARISEEVIDNANDDIKEIIHKSLKERIIDTSKSNNINLEINKEIMLLSEDMRIKLVNELKSDVENLTKQGIDLNTNKMTSLFPEDKREEYFAKMNVTSNTKNNISRIKPDSIISEESSNELDTDDDYIYFSPPFVTNRARAKSNDKIQRD